MIRKIWALIWTLAITLVGFGAIILALVFLFFNGDVIIVKAVLWTLVLFHEYGMLIGGMAIGLTGVALWLVLLRTLRSLTGKVRERTGKAQKKVAVVGLEKERREVKSVSMRKVAEFISLFTPEDFKDRIVGQDRAVSELVKGLKLGAQQFLRGNEKRGRVLCSVIFVGATGVGKTETAKALADKLQRFGYQFIRIDLNTYRDTYSATSLIGPPRGYLGSTEGGILTRPLMENPRAVILFDEMEKAHPDLHTVFMTMLDEGYIEEQSTGTKVYLDGAIIIFTSNHAGREIADMTRMEKDPIVLELRIREIMERYFGRPEIVGRIDRIVPFKNLEVLDLEEIARRVLRRYGMEGRAGEFTWKYFQVAEKYGVRMFVKKIEESALLGEESGPKGKGIEIFDV